MNILIYFTPLVVLASCAPIPHWSTYAPSYKGVVRDSHSKPIEGASVTYHYRNALVIDKCVTKSDGTFELKPLRQFHYMVYLGSPGVAPFPIGLKYSSSYPNSITIATSNKVDTYWIGPKENYTSFTANTDLKGVPFLKDSTNSWLKPEAKWIGPSPVLITQ